MCWLNTGKPRYNEPLCNESLYLTNDYFPPGLVIIFVHNISVSISCFNVTVTQFVYSNGQLVKSKLKVKENKALT